MDFDLEGFLSEKRTKCEIEAQAYVHLANYLALMKVAGNSLPQNIAHMVQPAVASTEFDRKRFKGKDIQLAFDEYLSRLSQGLPDKCSYATSNNKGKRAGLMRHLMLMEYAMRNVPELKAAFKSKEDHPYENIRKRAHEANIFIPTLDEALISVTTPVDSVFLPHLVQAYNNACAYLIRTRKKLILGKSVVVKSVKDLKEKLRLSLDGRQITTVPEDQALPHANWLAYALSKVPDLKRLESTYRPRLKPAYQP